MPPFLSALTGMHEARTSRVSVRNACPGQVHQHLSDLVRAKGKLLVTVLSMGSHVLSQLSDPKEPFGPGDISSWNGVGSVVGSDAWYCCVPGFQSPSPRWVAVNTV